MAFQPLKSPLFCGHIGRHREARSLHHPHHPFGYTQFGRKVWCGKELHLGSLLESAVLFGGEVVFECFAEYL